jgi:predicted nucleotidyltransferase
MSTTPCLQLLPGSIQELTRRIIQELAPEEIILFGSRARGAHRENSDFDIAVKAPQALSCSLGSYSTGHR